MKRVKRLRKFILFIYDAALFAFSYATALLISTYLIKAASSDYGTIATLYPMRHELALSAAILFICVFVFRFIFRIYSNVTRFENYSSYVLMIVADGLGGLTAMSIMFYVQGIYLGLWSSMAAAMLFCLFALFSRFLYRFMLRRKSIMANMSGKRTVGEVNLEDLLFRKGLKVGSSNYCGKYSGKVILITGGGGSIGSELCRQLAALSPKWLIVFDIYENNAYDIEQELRHLYGDSLNLAIEIGSVRDRTRLEAVFAHYSPDIVFHAAAHKHVPLMEHNGCEAVKNNVFGTLNAADMAEKYLAERFILISSDKAVNPTSIMGATKRFCEMLIQSRTEGKTIYTAVRFGNVLGSNGSVVPLFRKQIEAGGPVTITDKRVVRYFMTIGEAAHLVLESGVLAENGEIFVLDMGKPISILRLAEKMIQLLGLRPYHDIDIQEVGMRPGEKMFEETLIYKKQKTSNPQIFLENEEPVSRELVEGHLEKLKQAVKNAESGKSSGVIRDTLFGAVPQYRSTEEVNGEHLRDASSQHPDTEVANSEYEENLSVVTDNAR